MHLPSPGRRQTNGDVLVGWVSTFQKRLWWPAPCDSLSSWAMGQIVRDECSQSVAKRNDICHHEVGRNLVPAQEFTNKAALSDQESSRRVDSQTER
jgi:hypothetical protein